MITYDNFATIFLSCVWMLGGILMLLGRMPLPGMAESRKGQFCAGLVIVTIVLFDGYKRIYGV